MGLAYLLALQTAALPALPALTAPIAIDFDLARLAIPDVDLADPLGARRCARQEAGTILVCGRRPSAGAYPMVEMERLYGSRPLIAETRISGNVMGDVHVESAELPQNGISNRVMVRIRVPF